VSAATQLARKDLKTGDLAAVQRAEAGLLLPTYDRNKLLLRSGRGVYVTDSEGRRYLDFLSGIGVNALGYAHPAVLKALRKQAGRLIHVSNLFFHDYQAELAEKLTRISGLDRVFFTNSGTEAVEGAIKLARASARLNSKNGAKPKWRVIALQNSFHGRTFAALSATWTKKYREPFEPLMSGVRFVRLNDIADLERKFDASVCAILLEPVQGEGGVTPLTREFMARARSLTRQSGALLIADEIQCGLGRTGRWFAYQNFGVTPDIVTLAKPLAGGLPLGAILASDAVSAAIHPGMHGTTFGGGPLACAVAVAVLDTIERDSLLKHVGEIGAYLGRRLAELQQKHTLIKQVRGVGVMYGIDVADAECAKFVVREMLQRGVIVNRTHEVVIRLLPPYIIEKKHVDQLVRTMDRVLSDYEAQASPSKHPVNGNKKPPRRKA
jgi:acetylornithine/N-succinyldiaminopimelate aminotransferase